MKHKFLRKIASAAVIPFVSVPMVHAQGLVFDTPEQDFGVITTDSPVSRVFHFQNKGTDTITIRDILVSCGCTRIHVSRKVILPLQKDSIVMTYNPKGRDNGSQHLVADFWTSNQKKQWKQYLVTLTGTVDRKIPEITPEYQVDPNAANTYKALKPKDIFEEILFNKAFDLIYKADVQLVDKDAEPLDIHEVDEATERLLTTVRKGGYWESIDYNCYFRTNWEPTQHVNNLENFVRSYSNKDSKYYGNEALRLIINDALAYWIKANPRSHNWWHNQIGYCRYMTDVLVMMSRSAKGIDEDIKQQLMKKLMEPDVRKQDGANKTDIASYQFYIACLMKDDKLAKTLSKEAFYPIKITSKQGIQEDYSYHQHGAHLYIAGYGSVLIKAIVDMQYFLQGTPYSMSDEQLKLFDNFLDTYWDIYRGRCLDFNTTGRGLSRKGNLYNQLSLSMLDKCSALKGINTQKVKLFKERYLEEKPASYKVQNKNVNYWRSDYMLHNAPKYQASVNTASKRTRHTESINAENLLGGNLSYGTLQIMCSGKEYTDIFPVWEWDKIPGVTSNKTTNYGTSGLNGTSPFTGGVSTGTYGAFVYEHNHMGIRAYKSYFFTPNEVVALGGGINSANDNAIITTLNQCYLKGDAQYSDSADAIHSMHLGDSLQLDSPRWIWHDQIGYVFPKGGKFTVKTTMQEGNWANINVNGKDSVFQQPVFNLTCEHGVKPQQATYMYVMVPSCKKAAQLNSYDNVEALCNTAQCQAIRVKDSKVVMANFYQPYELKYKDISVQVDKPCALIIERGKHNALKVYVSDPTQTNQKINVAVSMNGTNKSVLVSCSKGITSTLQL